MKGLKFLSIAVCFFASLAFSQTPLNTAVDFTAKDSKGTSQNLFSYLTAGKYVLLEFTVYTG